VFGLLVRPDLTDAAALAELQLLLAQAAPLSPLPFSPVATAGDGDAASLPQASGTGKRSAAGAGAGAGGGSGAVMSDAEFREAYIPRRLADLGDEEAESRRLAAGDAAAASAPLAHYAAVAGMDLGAATAAAVAAERASRDSDLAAAAAAAAAAADGRLDPGGGGGGAAGRRGGKVRASDLLRQMGLDGFGRALPPAAPGAPPAGDGAGPPGVPAAADAVASAPAAAAAMDPDHAERAEAEMAGVAGCGPRLPNLCIAQRAAPPVCA
jgi:hypothetical protein